eukprot:TRINITY_DN12096_c1_g1_i1.p1 TRINITY_DN12096_c1_g1~~TRINITY_DN12096_c1_g1_i1.p1  ORF type:complete len:180 (+),score=31.95 TRINITY_DN12096_c1_g1_i1:59-598(+)
MDLEVVTSNAAKFAMVSGCCADLTKAGKLNLKQVDVDLPEYQFDSVEEVARAKVRAAYRMRGTPVVVQDSGFVVKKLHDFPGPYTKYIMNTIGVEGILRLMAGEKDREAGFDSAVCYCDGDDEENVRCFRERRKYWGTLTDSPRPVVNSMGQQWHTGARVSLACVFVPADGPSGRCCVE